MQSNQLSLPLQDDCKIKLEGHIVMHNKTKTNTETSQPMGSTPNNGSITTESHDWSNNQHRINSNFRTDSSQSHRGEGGLNAFYWYQNATLDCFVVEAFFPVLLSCQPRVTVTYVLFKIVKSNKNLYTLHELTRIDRSLVY